MVGDTLSGRKIIWLDFDISSFDIVDVFISLYNMVINVGVEDKIARYFLVDFGKFCFVGN